jgi:hypothetical protein
MWDSGAFAVLPDASLYDGLELKFFGFPLMTRTANPTIHLKADTATRYDGSTYLKKINYIVETEYGPRYSAASYIEIEAGMVVLKSIRDEWWVIQGNVTSSTIWTG